MMSVPGFEAEAAIYRRTLAYQVAWSAGAAVGLGVEPMLLRPSPSASGESGPGQCVPFCEECEGDINFPTGCSKACTAKNCTESRVMCSGCPDRCPGGQICKGVCKNTSTDPANCGGCGNACPPGVTCQNGSCGCPPGQIICNGVCTDPRSNRSNCGTCGHACGVNQICQNGACVEANCQVFCSTWNSCNQTCGPWPPGISNAQCWLDCLSTTVNCLTSTCGT